MELSQTAKKLNQPLPVPTQVPRFDVNDPEGYKYLEDHGYCVFKDVATEEQLEIGRSLAWDFLESLPVGIKRDDVATWDTPKWPDPFRKGIVIANGVGQSSFLWYTRSLPKVHSIFSKIWNTDQLMTSFDGFCIHRPFEYNETWKTHSELWYHLDQNGCHKPGRVCIQGIMNYYPSGPDDGGLVVVAKSHTIFNQIFNSRPHFANKKDFVGLANNRKLWTKEIPAAKLEVIKIIAEAGDFILWDSRVIHCNCPASTARPIPSDGSILPPRRLAAYVCMTPQDRLTPTIQEKRIQCYLEGRTTSHWPEDVFSPHMRANYVGFRPPELTPEQKRLVPMD